MAITLESVLAANDGPARDLRGFMQTAIEAIPLEPVEDDINDVDAFRAAAAVHAFAAALTLTGNVQAAFTLWQKVYNWTVEAAPAPGQEAYELLHADTVAAKRLRRVAQAAVIGEPRGPRKAEFTVATWRAYARRHVCKLARQIAASSPDSAVEPFELFNTAMQWAANSTQMG